MLSKIKSYMHIRMYMYEFSIWTSKLVKGESHLGQLTSWLVASSMRRKSFLVTTNKLQIWSVWIVLDCICLECNLLEIKLPTYLPSEKKDITFLTLIFSTTRQRQIELVNSLNLYSARYIRIWAQSTKIKPINCFFISHILLHNRIITHIFLSW